MSKDVSVQATEAQKLEDLTGMGIPVEEIVDAPPAEEAKPEVKPEPKPEAKSHSESEEEEEDDEAEAEEQQDRGKDEERSEPTERTPRPAKNERPLKAIFSQIKELRSAIDALKASPQKEEAKETVDEIKQIAEKRELDPEGLAEIIALAQKRVLDDLEKSGKLSKDLPAEVQDKLKLLDQIQADNKAKEEAIHFEKEWNGLLSELQKQYPNAKPGELAEAKKTMDELAHSKAFHKYDLDYVLFKNKSKFDALLKVAKNTKSGETSSKQIEDYNEEEDIDLDPENMTPEKMKAYQKRKLNMRDDKVEFLG